VSAPKDWGPRLHTLIVKALAVEEEALLRLVASSSNVSKVFDLWEDDAPEDGDAIADQLATLNPGPWSVTAFPVELVMDGAVQGAALGKTTLPRLAPVLSGWAWLGILAGAGLTVAGGVAAWPKIKPKLDRVLKR